jgi:hypothetical protein
VEEWADESRADGRKEGHKDGEEMKDTERWRKMGDRERADVKYDEGKTEAIEKR